MEDLYNPDGKTNPEKRAFIKTMMFGSLYSSQHQGIEKLREYAKSYEHLYYYKRKQQMKKHKLLAAAAFCILAVMAFIYFQPDKKVDKETYNEVFHDTTVVDPEESGAYAQVNFWVDPSGKCWREMDGIEIRTIPCPTDKAILATFGKIKFQH